MSPEPIRVLVAVHDPGCLEVIRGSLRMQDGYETVEVDPPAAFSSLPTDTPHDIVLAEIPASAAEAGAPVPIAGPPILLLAEPGQEAWVPDHAACAGYLSKRDLSAVLLRHALRFTIERCRAEHERERTARALTTSEHRYRGLFEQSRDAIVMTDGHGRIVEANDAAGELLGRGARDLVGADVLEAFAEPAERDRFRSALETRGHVRDDEVRLRRSDGSERWCLVSAWRRHDSDDRQEGYQGIAHDITDRKEVEGRLAYEAFHDGLTGLPNRALFMDRLERAVARRRRGEERQLAVLFLDMDRFKVVNDSLGHLVGDDLLRQLGRLLQEQVREEDTVARIGGDEFAILLDGVDDPADPTHVAERIQEQLRNPFSLDGHDVFASVSIGITFGGADTRRAEDLLRDADTAMYRAKEMGPARYQIFDHAMHAHAVTLLQLETDLRLALDRKEFVLHYQPIFDLEGRLLGFEALIRWLHPQRGLLHPQSFIPIAVDTGLIVPIGEWSIHTAIRQLGLWKDQHLFMAVNVADRQLNANDLPDAIDRLLIENGVRPQALRLEFTESALLRHPEASAARLRAIQSLGIDLCVDDFGTGYTSLNHLHDLPIDYLKIDRSFVDRLDRDPDGDELVATIVALARSLGLRTVAEGVETPHQMDRLRHLGASAVQGFLFSPAVDEGAASALLRDRPVGR